MQKPVECYRLWKNGSWDKVTICVEIPIDLKDDVEFIETRAVEQAWIELLDQNDKPLQIGLYMISIYEIQND